jgi:hypothetical protein
MLALSLIALASFATNTSDIDLECETIYQGHTATLGDVKMNLSMRYRIQPSRNEISYYAKFKDDWQSLCGMLPRLAANCQVEMTTSQVSFSWFHPDDAGWFQKVTFDRRSGHYLSVSKSPETNTRSEGTCKKVLLSPVDNTKDAF